MSSYISDADALVASLPYSITRDTDKEKLAQVVAEELVKNVNFTDYSAIFPRIDGLPEEVLDILAYDLKIDWYEADAPLWNKRQAVKDCILVHKFKGTKYAVETALRSMYNSAEVTEWFEYDGEPFHFRVNVYGSTGSGLKTLYLKIQYAKNLRSVMDSVQFTLIPEKDIEVFIGSRLAMLDKQICTSLESRSEDVFTVGEKYYAGITYNGKTEEIKVFSHFDIPPADAFGTQITAGISLECREKHIYSYLRSEKIPDAPQATKGNYTAVAKAAYFVKNIRMEADLL